MSSIVSLTTDPALWRFAALLVGGLLGIVLGTFAMMYAFVRPHGNEA